jgi:arylsulfatase A-like enzyme
VIERWVRQMEGLPIFVWVHLYDAHMPYAPPDEYVERYYGDVDRAYDPSLPPPAEVPETFFTEHHQYFIGLKDLAFPPAMYRAEIDSLDHELGRLLEMPELQGAVVGFTADHGEVLGQHGIYYGHTGLYPDTVHVPLIVSAPGAPAGVRSNLPVTHTDLGRTLLDLAGLANIGFPGRNLIELVESGEPPSAPRFTLAANALEASITWSDWHLILRRRNSGGHRVELVKAHSVELYRLDDDPACERDLIDEELEDATRLRAQLLDWLASVDDRGWAGQASQDEELLRQLEALGYAAGDDGQIGVDFGVEDCECEWCVRFAE